MGREAFARAVGGCILAVYFALGGVPAWAQPIVVDHTCTDLAAIPASVIEQVRTGRKVHYAHTSHGSQINIGMELIENATYSVEFGYRELPSAPGVLCVFDGQEGDDYVTPDLYWQTAQGLQNTRNVLNHNPSLTNSMWGWCTQLDYYSAAEVQQYLDAMSQLETEFPTRVFVYYTGNAQATGSEGYNRHQRNQQIRQYCQQHNKVLFDFADLDAWWYNQGAGSWEQATYSYSGQQIPVEHAQFHGDNGGHTNDASCIQKARAWWWLLARLQGWNGAADCAVAPGNLVLTPSPQTHSIGLGWQDNSSNENSFVIQRQYNNGAWNNSYHTVGAGVTSYTDTGLSDGTYGYRVVAHRNDDGTGSPCDSSPSGTASATLSSSPPAAPSGLTARLDVAGVALGWQDNSANEEHFVLQRAMDGGAFGQLAELGAGTVSYLDTAVEAGHFYGYRVQSSNAFGTSAFSNTVWVTVYGLGDVNGDGRVNIVDETILAHVLVGNLDPGEPPCRCGSCGDWNGDGALGSQDAAGLAAWLGEWTSSGTALCPGQTPDFITNRDIYQAGTGPEPSPRVPFTEPVFDTCLVRLTNHATDLAPGDGGVGLMNERPDLQAWNADESRVLLQSTGWNWYLYDAVTLLPAGAVAIDGLEPRWDACQPQTLFYQDWNHQMVRLNVETGQATVVHDFRADFPGHTLASVWSNYMGSPSRDGRYWGFMAEDDPSWVAFALLVFDLQSAQVVATRNLPSNHDLAGVTMSPQGNYLVAFFNDYAEPGFLGTEADPRGIMVYDRNLANGRGLVRQGSPAAVALDGQGREVLVYVDYDANFISMVNLADGTVTPLWEIDVTHAWLNNRFSGHAFGRPGWVLVSTFDEDPVAQNWMSNQVFAVELAAGGRTVRLAHHRSRLDTTQDDTYLAEPKATVNRSFTRLLFTSNWGRSGAAVDEVEVYLLELPSNWPAALP